MALCAPGCPCPVAPAIRSFMHALTRERPVPKPHFEGCFLGHSWDQPACQSGCRQEAAPPPPDEGQDSLMKRRGGDVSGAEGPMRGAKPPLPGPEAAVGEMLSPKEKWEVESRRRGHMARGSRPLPERNASAGGAGFPTQLEAAGGQTPPW